jgi:hypothetical protein
MSTELHPPTATIHAFPAGGRAGLKAKKALGEEPAYTVAAFGSGWYHDAAIEEDTDPSCERVTRLYGDRH